MEEQKKRNPLETEKEGKLIAKFAIPAIISMLVSSLYNIVDLRRVESLFLTLIFRYTATFGCE